MYRFLGGYASFDADTINGCHYYIADYLGNNRMVVNGRTGDVEQVNSYYPYGGFVAGAITGATMGAGATWAGTSYEATALITGSANAIGTITDKIVTNSIDDATSYSTDNLISDGKDVLVSGAIGVMAGVGSKYINAAASEASRGANQVYSNFEKTAAMNTKSFLPKSDGSNLSTRLKVAEECKQTTCSNLKTDATGLAAVAGAENAVCHVISSSGTTIMGIGYDERVNNKR